MEGRESGLLNSEGLDVSKANIRQCLLYKSQAAESWERCVAGDIRVCMLQPIFNYDKCGLAVGGVVVVYIG